MQVDLYKQNFNQLQSHASVLAGQTLLGIGFNIINIFSIKSGIGGICNYSSPLKRESTIHYTATFFIGLSNGVRSLLNGHFLR